jgi:peptidoglycan/LPS O-acetylase OafA/YrhL
MRRLLARLRRDLWERPPGRFEPLDGLRAFASLSVVLFHCGIFSGALGAFSGSAGTLGPFEWLVTGFWSGVDIFFVLSGFLIGRILLVNLARDRSLRWPDFMRRRFFRIVPAYYLVLTVSLLGIAPSMPGLFPYLYLTADWQRLLDGAWASYAFLSNYVQPGSRPGLLTWGWSVCIEEHFYLLLPPVLWLLFRLRSARLRFPLLALLALVPLALRAAQYELRPNLLLLEGFYYYTHNRFDELLVGTLVAYAYVMHRERLALEVRAAGAWTGLLGVGLVASVWWAGGLHRTGPFSVVWQFLVVALGTALLVLNGLFLDNRLSRVLAHRAWVPFARISYGTYLIHPFVIFAWLSAYGLTPEQNLGAGGFALLSLATIAGSSLVAALSFSFVERPLLERGARAAGN